MADEKKKPEEEKVEPKPAESKADTETPKPEPKDEPKPPEKPQEKSEEKPADEKQDNNEGAKLEEKPTDESREEAPPEAEPPKLSVEDQLKAENLTLKTQLEAMKLGFRPDCIEDAVVLAENIVKRDGSDIATALQAVAKKYPDWKQQANDKEKHKGGFKIGSDGGNSKQTSEDKLNKAFGIKKKG